MPGGSVYRAGAAGGRVSSLLRIFLLAAAMLACMVTVAGAAGGRPKLRGMTLGGVTGFDEDRLLVMVDIGSKDGVLKGLPFAVVDGRGSQVALIEAGEVFDDLFWSAPLKSSEYRRVEYGMQVRWVFTPETTSLVAARKKGTPEAYRSYLDAYPDGRFVTGFVKAMDPDMMQALDPEFRAAWDDYTSDSLAAYAAAHPRTALGKAASEEAVAIKAYEAEKEKARTKEEKAAGKAGVAGAVPKTPDGGEPAEPLPGRTEDPFTLSHRGTLVNNSSSQVTFEFEYPGRLTRTAVEPFGQVEVTHQAGTFTYRVYGTPDTFGAQPDAGGFGSSGFDDGLGDGFDDGFGTQGDFGMDDGFADTPAQAAPLKIGTVDIQFDMWEITYP